MVGFCGALDFESRSVKFSVLKKMCGLHSTGCAFINKEFGILCDEYEGCEPLTVSYNNALYTAAVVAPKGQTMCAQAILQGYFEEGEEYFRSIDFPFALALYDGRCGELTLAKGAEGDKALFYGMKDGVMYFASALRPLIRLYGGCVRVNADVLAGYIDGDYSGVPDNLFCDIRPLRSNTALVCSSFGHSIVPLELCGYAPKRCCDEFEQISGKYTDMRHFLTEALFAFDYPQFDCYMPAICRQLEKNSAADIKVLRTYDCIPVRYSEYVNERNEQLGRLWGVDLKTTYSERSLIGKRELRKMEKQIDGILSGYLESAALRVILQKIPYEKINSESDIALRIRKKALLCQSGMWFEGFSLVFD